MFERFAAEARAVVEQACEEAVLLGHAFIGTEHLLLGLFAHDHLARRVLETRGVTRTGLLQEYRGVVDTCELPAGPRPDPAALASVGIDLEEVRRRVEDAFGSGALERTSAWRGRARPRFTPRAKRALELAVREASALGDRQLVAEHLLLGVCAVEDGLAARLLARRGLTLSVVRSAIEEARRRSA